ncbi:MAG: RDD family protein [Halieaceae bacterium]|jgi:uncharacterized RDD family membrane protein YckC|nr:RDD family protein [Halieaceae bacterium]
MQQFERPGLFRRLAAMLYDTFLVLPMIMAVIAVATAIGVAITGDPGNQDYSATLPPWLVRMLVALCIVGFYGYFWRQKGQTLGMQAWRIRLRGFGSDEAAPISGRQVLLRCLGAIVSLAPAGAGYLWCLVDRNKRSWHDHISKTELELLPKPVKNRNSEKAA